MKKHILLITTLLSVSAIQAMQNVTVLNVSTKYKVTVIPDLAVPGGRIEYGTTKIIEPGKKVVFNNPNDLKATQFILKAKALNQRPIEERVLFKPNPSKPIVVVDVGYVSGGSAYSKPTITYKQMSVAEINAPNAPKSYRMAYNSYAQ